LSTQTYDAYWRAYLLGHASRTTRIVHYAGLFFAPLTGLAVAWATHWWAFFVIAPTFYLAAFLTHPLIEHNSNKPFADRPLWSAISLLRMLALDMAGRLGPQLRRAQEGQV
jgi:hypothetical protein